MFWFVLMFVLIFLSIALMGVIDIFEQEELEDEYETAYYIVYK